MDTVLLVVGAVLYRLFLLSLERLYLKGIDWVWLVIVFSLPLVGIPLILIKEGVLDGSAINICMAGFLFFYFPFVLGRINKNKNKSSQGNGFLS